VTSYAADPHAAPWPLPVAAPSRVSAGAPGLPQGLRTDLPTVPASGSSWGVLTAYVDSGILYLDGRALVTRRLVDVRAPRIDAARMPKTSPVAASGTPRSRGAGLVAVPSAVVAGSVGDPAREESA